MDAQEYLSTSDAYSFFAALNDAIMIGPTGTNVRDVRVLLAN
jgi:glycerate-2-kinase